METPTHNLQHLFMQLGLESDEEAINTFILEHEVPENTSLHKAYFWNPAQSQFIKESWQQDADWAEVVDQLATMLQK